MKCCLAWLIIKWIRSTPATSQQLQSDSSRDGLCPDGLARGAPKCLLQSTVRVRKADSDSLIIYDTNKVMGVGSEESKVFEASNNLNFIVDNLKSFEKYLKVIKSSLKTPFTLLMSLSSMKTR